MRAFTAGSGMREATGSGRGLSRHRGGETAATVGQERTTGCSIQGVKWCQYVCIALIVEGINGLQSRLRRFDSDPSLHKTKC